MLRFPASLWSQLEDRIRNALHSDSPDTDSKVNAIIKRLKKASSKHSIKRSERLLAHIKSAVDDPEFNFPGGLHCEVLLALLSTSGPDLLQDIVTYRYITPPCLGTATSSRVHPDLRSASRAKHLGCINICTTLFTFFPLLVSLSYALFPSLALSRSALLYLNYIVLYVVKYCLPTTVERQSEYLVSFSRSCSAPR